MRIVFKTGGIRLKIYIDNQILEFQNSRENVAEILIAIEDAINKTSDTIKSMDIDGEEVFSGYDNYLLDHINQIEEVKINLISYQELVNDTIDTALEYLENAPDLVGKLADDFYKQPDDTSWATLADLLGGLDWIINMNQAVKAEAKLEEVAKKQTGWAEYSDIVSEFDDVIGDFEEAILTKDTVMIADVLSYEIKTRYADMAKQLKPSLD